MLINKYITTAFTLLVCRAAILDFEVGLVMFLQLCELEIRLQGWFTFSDWKLRNSNLPVQIESIISAVWMVSVFVHKLEYEPHSLQQ